MKVNMNMENSLVQLTDLPDEILINIFKKISNVEVLYSCIGVNRRLNKIAHDRILTSYLDLTIRLSCGCLKPLPSPMLDRFCLQILPEIHDKIHWLNLESSSMKHILLATNYPNLYGLGLYDVDLKSVEQLFTEEISLIQMFQNQISSLIINVTKGETSISRKHIVEHLFTQIFLIFNKLQYLNFCFHSIDFQRFSFTMASSSLFSSTLLELHVSLGSFLDCLYLLDGRFNQLQTFYVYISYISLDSTIDNKEKLPNLRCFSLSCENEINNYDETIKPLLHRMLNLDTLHLSFTCQRSIFIDGNELKRNILNHMPQLNTFTFNICSSSRHSNQLDLRSNKDIQETFTDLKNDQIICCVDYFQERNSSQCYIYSQPYQLTYYNNITNHFPGGLFKHVSSASLFDEHPFEHAFFVRITQSFPFLQKLTCINKRGQKNKQCRYSNNHQNLTIIEYPHLKQLNLLQAHQDYIEQFLLAARTRLPYHVRLYADYEPMKNVTFDFTRNFTRVNCSKINYMCTKCPPQLPKYFNDYFFCIYTGIF